MTPDVNVLVAGSRLDPPHHSLALAWLDAALEDCEKGRPLAIYPMVAAGFLRLVTHPKVFVQPAPHDAALAFLRAVVNSPGVEMPRLGSEWPVFERLCEHPADRQRHPRCLDRRRRAGPARSPSEFRQGIPPFPEEERIHFAEALNLRVHDILHSEQVRMELRAWPTIPDGPV